MWVIYGLAFAGRPAVLQSCRPRSAAHEPPQPTVRATQHEKCSILTLPFPVKCRIYRLSCKMFLFFLICLLLFRNFNKDTASRPRLYFAGLLECQPLLTDKMWYQIVSKPLMVRLKTNMSSMWDGLEINKHIDRNMSLFLLSCLDLWYSGRTIRICESYSRGKLLLP